MYIIILRISYESTLLMIGYYGYSMTNFLKVIREDTQKNVFLVVQPISPGIDRWNVHFEEIVA